MKNSSREYVIALGGKITNLRSELQRVQIELDTAEGELDRVLSYPTEDTVSLTDDLCLPAGSGSVSHEISMAQRIIALLSENPDKEYDAEDVQRTLGVDNPLPSIRSALARLSDGDNGKIERAGRGTYRAKRDARSPEEAFGTINLQ